VWANPDGSFTRKVAAVPERWRDDRGGWHDLDLTLAAGADGSLAPRSAVPGAAPRLPATADGPATLPTGAGVFGLAHPGAARQPAASSGGRARYVGALGGRDLVAQVLVHGLEESVVLPDAAAPASWTDVFTVPVGVDARAGGSGVEFVDAAGRVVASFGGGVAHDANQAAPGGQGAAAGVATRLVGRAGRTVRVQVGVDPGWVADPARVFPVTVDPVFYANTAGAGNDTWVQSDQSDPSVPSGWSSTRLRMGYGFGPDGPGGTAVARTLLWFDVGSPVAGNKLVSEAHLAIYNDSSSSCTPKAVYASGLASGFNAATRWNTAPGADGSGWCRPRPLPTAPPGARRRGRPWI
jgi:hypothetical protein